MKHYCHISSPFGTLLAVAEHGHLTGLFFSDRKHAPTPGADWVEDPEAAPFPEVRSQFSEFVAGRRRDFDIPVRLEGTEFQKAVWDRISAIPFGRTVQYNEIARALGRPTASRAAGHATGRNPVSIIVPCHRVVGIGGRITGYAGGVNRKEELLRLEKTCLLQEV